MPLAANARLGRALRVLRRSLEGSSADREIAGHAILILRHRCCQWFWYNNVLVQECTRNNWAQVERQQSQMVLPLSLLGTSWHPVRPCTLQNHNCNDGPSDRDQVLEGKDCTANVPVICRKKGDGNGQGLGWFVCNCVCYFNWRNDHMVVGATCKTWEFASISECGTSHMIPCACCPSPLSAFMSWMSSSLSVCTLGPSECRLTQPIATMCLLMLLMPDIILSDHA